MQPVQVLQIGGCALLVVPECFGKFPMLVFNVAVEEAEIGASVVTVGRKLSPITFIFLVGPTAHDEDPVISGLLVLINECETVRSRDADG